MTLDELLQILLREFCAAIAHVRVAAELIVVGGGFPGFAREGLDCAVEGGEDGEALRGGRRGGVEEGGDGGDIAREGGEDVDGTDFADYVGDH